MVIPEGNTSTHHLLLTQGLLVKLSALGGESGNPTCQGQFSPVNEELKEFLGKKFTQW